MLDMRVKQQELEHRVRIEAQSRAYKDANEAKQRGEWGSSRTGSKFVQSVMDQEDTDGNLSYTSSIRDFIVNNANRGAGASLIAAKLLQQSCLSAEVIALVSTRTILNMALRSGPIKRSSLCMYVGAAIDTEVSIRRFSETKQRKALLKKLFKDFDRRTYPKHWRIRTIKNYFDAEQVSWSQWEPKQQLSVGFALLAMFRNSTGLLDFSSDGTHIELSPKLEEV